MALANKQLQGILAPSDICSEKFWERGIIKLHLQVDPPADYRAFLFLNAINELIPAAK
jgi:hypothetical protein